MKKISKLLLIFLISTLFFTANSVAANDYVQQNFTYSDGTLGGINFYLTYPDVRCGMNTKAHFTAASTKNLSRMEVDWTTYSTGGVALEYGHRPLINTTYLYDSSSVKVIGRAYAEYILKYKTQTWKPKGNAYHCVSVSSFSDTLNPQIHPAKDAINDLERKDSLPYQYSNIDKYHSIDQYKIVTDIFNQYYHKDLGVYKLDNGRTLTAENLEIESIIQETGYEFNDKKLGYSINSEELTDFIYIKVSAPTNISKDGKSFKLDGYITISKDPKQEKIDFGLIETELE